MIKLYDFQKKVLEDTKNFNRVGYYLDCGLGKTFVSTEKMVQLGYNTNVVVCQKSKITDWIDHFKTNYPTYEVFDLTRKKELANFLLDTSRYSVGVINYDLVWRKEELAQLTDFTLILDESSLIQNYSSKRTKFILRKLKPANVLLLSGTVCSGKYENLWTQMKLLGWNITKEMFYQQYINFHYDTRQGFPLMIVDGYKNVDRLKQKMHDYGCVFLRTDEAFDLPEQVFQTINVPTTKEYKTFLKNRIVGIGDRKFVGDTALNKLLWSRQLCGSYNSEKLSALEDLLSSTEDRVLIFYNFSTELYEIENICHRLDKPVSIVNGRTKDLSCYEEYDNAVTLIQYQAGAMGLNLQKACRIIYFTPPLSSDLYEQSKKRIHRLNQKQTCFYYNLTCGVEKHIYKVLDQRRDYNEVLFNKDLEDEGISSNF